MLTITDLTKKVLNNNPAVDIAVINKAYEFAEIAHAGQLRYSKEPYIDHCLGVADILIGYRTDTVCIVAGLLHDVIEKGGVTKEEVAKEFGSDVAFIIDSASRISNLDHRVSEEMKLGENIRKMILAMSVDLRVVIIKIAEYVHSMKSISFVPEPKRHLQAKKILEIFAPLADRLGMEEAKGMLEDMAFPVLFPTEYQATKKLSEAYYSHAGDLLAKATRDLHAELGKAGIRAHILSRPKRLYSLWKKLNRPESNHDINRVYDLLAMRVLVDQIKDCYAVLGIVHQLWVPVISAGGVRDYIARPKPNGYQSIHTNVFIQNNVAEIQIRTHQMHEQAQNGIAAHWHYSEVKTSGASDKALDSRGTFAPTAKLVWVKQLVDWQNEVVDTTEYLNALKFDALADRIFVFSPKGDVYDLPLNATPIDFAYIVHTNLGHQANGARINGKMCKLDQPLQNGDVVDIIKDEKTGPAPKWLSIVITQKAKEEIRKFLEQKRSD